MLVSQASYGGVCRFVRQYRNREHLTPWTSTSGLEVDPCTIACGCSFSYANLHLLAILDMMIIVFFVLAYTRQSQGSLGVGPGYEDRGAD